MFLEVDENDHAAIIDALLLKAHAINTGMTTPPLAAEDLGTTPYTREQIHDLAKRLYRAPMEGPGDGLLEMTKEIGGLLKELRKLIEKLRSSQLELLAAAKEAKEEIAKGQVDATEFEREYPYAFGIWKRLKQAIEKAEAK